MAGLGGVTGGAETGYVRSEKGVPDVHMARPPNTVMSIDFRAPYLDRSREYQKAISRKDETLVNSQNP